MLLKDGETDNPFVYLALVDMFVDKLARSSNGGAINYKLADLEKFVDSFKDVAVLMYVSSLFQRAAFKDIPPLPSNRILAALPPLERPTDPFFFTSHR